MLRFLCKPLLGTIAAVTLALCFMGLGVAPVQAASDKYRLAWTGDPATTMTIGWCQVSGTATGVKYGTDATLTTFNTATTITTQTYDNTLHPEGTPLVSHFVELTGLTPDTVYYFQTYDSEGDNEIYYFKTSPNTPGKVTFIAGGDSRTHQEPRQWGNQLVSKLRPLVVAFGGDYHDDCTNDEMREWLDDWQLTISSDNRMVPILPAHGNHENDMTEFVELVFNMPNPDAYYATNVGGTMMRMYSLNSELEPGVGYGAFTDQDDTKWNAQATWLAADMAANSGYTWKIGQFHRPMRPHQSGKSEGTGRIDAWAQTMYDNGMDLVIDCDSHLVKYTYPLAPSENAGSFESFVRDDADGAMFIGEGSWGAPHRANDDDKPWTLSSDSFWQFKLIQADATNIFIRTVKFGEYDESGVPALGYNMADVAELTQAEQDADPFAMPAGLDAILWKPLAGDMIALNASGDLFTGADVDNVEYVSTGSSWNYLDDGSDQGTAWTAANFDDSAWASGDAQFGYGDGDETTVISYGDDASDKHITAYFRKAFTVADAGQVIKLKAMLLRDDGAIVYINGTEAVRSNISDGEVTYTTTANDAGSETTYYEYNIDPALLVSGDNTIAVEVHQSGPTSSDTSFDMVLVGIESNVTGSAPAAPTLLAETSVTTTTIDIAWTDNATDEVGYELWRKEGDGSWEILEPGLAADTAAYGDTMLSEGTEYTYKVRAYNAAGLSALCDEVAVTTATASTPLVYSEDFDSGTFGQFITVDVASSASWEFYDMGDDGMVAKMNGYGADEASDDWLISPALNIYAYGGEYVTADLAYNYGGPEIQVLVSDNYDPEVHSDPNDAHWVDTGAAMPSIGSYIFETTGELSFDLAAVDFDDSTFGSFTVYSVASDADWAIEERADKIGAVANGFGAAVASDDWLISPPLSVGAGAGIEVAFNLYRKYGGPELQVMVSTDYTGSGDPTAATWTAYTVFHDDIYDAWKYVSVTHEFAADATAYAAFRYTSTGTGSGDGARLGVDDIVIQPTTARVAFHYISTGTDGGDGRVWEVDNVEFRGNRVSYAAEDFNEDLISATTFTAHSAASNADWIIGERADQKGAIANGYGADGPSDDWLISPAMLLAPTECAELLFDFYYKYGGPELQVMISEDYDGSSDPTDESFTWDAVTIPFDSDYTDAWKPVSVDLCSYSGTVYVAFRYTSTGTGGGQGARIGVDNVQVVRKSVTGLAVDFTGTPTELTTLDAEVSFTAYVSGGATPYTYVWEFGTGDASNDENPVCTYPAAGTYTVALCVTDADGEKICKTKENLVTVEQATVYSVPVKMGGLRVATFNCYLNRSSQGQIVTDLASGTDEQIRKVAEIIQRTNPDVILLNEFDYVADGSAVALLKQNYLEVSQNGAAPIYFPYTFIAESNTGVASGYDFDNDGNTASGGNDCYGYGDFYGQYAMAFLSKYPIDEANVRTFQKFLWTDMPNNVMPTDYYDAEEQAIFRLSSKSHWDIPVEVGGETVHMLCSHPTPPTFDDGDADLDANLYDWNGKRNHDEIRFWADYVTPGSDGYIYDDNNTSGGLGADARFVILGDENADPDEGDSYQNAIMQLLNTAAINTDYIPTSDGAVDDGLDSDDTASWGMRADYNLPSEYGLEPRQGQVFWPTSTDDLYYLVEADGSSDHRMVWMDLSVMPDALDGDLDSDGDVDRDDAAIIRGHLRQDASVCPECDLDGDGTITVRDFRKLMSICTCPRCVCP